jgi:hypothetical protein
MDGQVALTLALGGQKAVLNGSFNLPREARSVHVVADLSQVTPKALAASAPILAPLATLDVPLELSGEADLGPDLKPVHLSVTARAGAGKLDMDGGSIPIRRAELTLAGTPEEATLRNAVVELQPTRRGFDRWRDRPDDPSVGAADRYTSPDAGPCRFRRSARALASEFLAANPRLDFGKYHDRHGIRRQSRPRA